VFAYRTNTCGRRCIEVGPLTHYAPCRIHPHPRAALTCPGWALGKRPLTPGGADPSEIVLLGSLVVSWPPIPSVRAACDKGSVFGRSAGSTLRRCTENLLRSIDGDLMARQRRRGSMKTEAAKDTTKQVLEALQHEPLRPRELVAKLQATSDEPAVRRAVWKLLDQGSVGVTPDRKLRASAKR
jgi:hypothetical protein